MGNGPQGWKRKKALIPLALLAVLAALGAGLYLRHWMMEARVNIDTFYPGVTVDQRDLSGLTLDQALSQWAQEDLAAAQAMTLTLTLGEERWTVDAQAMGYASDYRQVLEQAYALGRQGGLASRYRQVRQLAREGAAFTTHRRYDPQQLAQALQTLAHSLTYVPQDARVSGFDAQNRAFTFTPERAGAHVDAQRLCQQAEALLDQGRGGEIAIQVEVVPPGVTQGQLARQYGLIAQAVTPAAASSASRLTNIALALDAIDGVEIGQGQTFSFNQATGQRTPQKGYQSAGAIDNGVMVQEPGGGVCQVSTTLFNAAAKAGLSILSRSPHSRAVGYVSLGLDAMVDWPSVDLRLSNPGDGPVYLVGELDGDKRVKVSVYGKKLPEGTSYALSVQVTGSTPPGEDRFIADPTLPAGEKRLLEAAREGTSAITYRDTLDAQGQVVRRETLAKSTYPPAGNVYLVGE